MKKSLIVNILILLMLTSCSITNNVMKERIFDVKIEKSDSLNDYQYDFLNMLQVLEDSHPDLYNNFQKKEFDKKSQKF